MAFDGAQFGKDIVEAVRGYVDRVVAPLEERIRELESGGIKFVGTWQRAATYHRGDVVTHDGSMWIALGKAHGIKPGSSPDAWQLSVKGK